MSAIRPSVYDLRLQADLLVLESENLGAGEFEERLQSLLDLIEDKGAAIRAVHHALASRKREMEAEAATFAARAKQANEALERLKGRAHLLLEAREAIGEPARLEGTWGSLALQNNSTPTMTVEDANAVPEAFWVQPPPPPRVVDRERVLTSVRAGIDVPGVVVVTGRHVRVR